MNLLRAISPFQNKRRIVAFDQSTGDIIAGLLATHDQYKTEYDKIYKQFDAPTNEGIARKIFSFLKEKCHYVIEPNGYQTLRSPAAILSLGMNPKIGLDCKSYSLFIAGILDAFRRHGRPINFTYRFASYKPHDRLPHHVFVVMKVNGKEIWIDPVMPTFNNRKSYFHSLDKKVPMSLYALSGIGRRSKEDRQLKKEDRKARKAAKKAKAKNAIKKRGKILLKFNPATASARNAVLLLLKLNIFQLAMKLHKLSMTGDKLKNFWEKIGGNYNNLLKNIMVGVKHHEKRHGKQVAGIGAAPAIAAAIAAATPIIIKFTQLLKAAGIDSKDLENAAKKVVQKVVNKKVDEAADQIAESELANEDQDMINEDQDMMPDDQDQDAEPDQLPMDEEADQQAEMGSLDRALSRVFRTDPQRKIYTVQQKGFKKLATKKF